jgi:hypothetical protein
MSELVITLVRVVCDEVTDDFLEGVTDEFGWRLTASGATGEGSLFREEIPMAGMENVAAGSEHELNRELWRLGPEWTSARLEFWDKDTFSRDDLLGRIEITRDGRGTVTVRAGESARVAEDGSFHLTGEGGDYKVWLSFQER